MRRTGGGSASGSSTRQAGLSLIELMVGLTVGLFVATAALAVLAINLRENRKLLLEARLLQDLRSASDLITRDLRHAGYWAAAEQGVALPATTGVVANPYAATWLASDASNTISFNYSRDGTENDAVDSNDQIGYRLRAGVVEVHVGSGGWQALTDSATFNVTEFRITATVRPIDLDGFCAKPCASGHADCSPRQEIRTLTLALGGNLAGDVSVSRRLQSEVRVRNDTLAGACAG
jgi:prepilin peptidase dependent protein B